MTPLKSLFTVTTFEVSFLWLPHSIVVVWSWLLDWLSVSLFCGVTARQIERRLSIHEGRTEKYDFVFQHLSKFRKWLEGAESCREFSKSVHLLLFWRHFHSSLCTGGVKILNFLLKRRPLGVNSDYLGLCM